MRPALPTPPLEYALILRRGKVSPLAPNAGSAENDAHLGSGCASATSSDARRQEYKRLASCGILPPLAVRHSGPEDPAQGPRTNGFADGASLVSKKCRAEFRAAVHLALGPLDHKGTSPAEPEAAEEGADTAARAGGR